MRKGISPVIATVIIVAVAIAISIAVAGWLFGLWGGLTSTQPEIKITPLRAVLDSTTNTITVDIYVTNNGNGADTILDAVLILPNGASVTADPAQLPVEIPANSENSVTLTFNIPANSATIGDRVTLEVVFAETGKHSAILTLTG